jgi:hypothetical protein
MDLVADMLFQGATAEEILEGYLTLNKEKLAILLVSRQLMSITLSRWWARRDSNPGPPACEAGALTN